MDHPLLFNSGCKCFMQTVPIRGEYRTKRALEEGKNSALHSALIINKSHSTGGMHVCLDGILLFFCKELMFYKAGTFKTVKCIIYFGKI